MNPTFDYEKIHWERGLRFVAGADEVGRGAFAGPVVTAAVVFDPLNTQLPEKVLIRDSKKMTQKQRKISSIWLKENVYWGIGEVSVNIINKVGVGKATQMAFRRAIAELNYHLPKRLEHLLVDAFFVPYVRGLSKSRQTAIVKGDSFSASISAASIIAKVHRDALMRNLAQKSKFKVYLWHKNVGYGTKTHLNAVLAHGTTPHHRKAFVETYLKNMRLKQPLFVSQEKLNA